MLKKTISNVRTKKKTKKILKGTRELTDKDILVAFQKISQSVFDLAEQVKVFTANTGSVLEDNAKEEVNINAPESAQLVKTSKKVQIPEIKARYELWAYDEYNQGSIVTSSPKLSVVLEVARKYCNEANVENALAGGEKDKAWEAYFPQIFVDGEVSLDVLYAGNKKDGKHYVYVRTADKWELRRPDNSVKFRFYLGQFNAGREKTDWYLANHRGQLITSLSDISLERKTILFIKVVQ